MPLPPTHFAVGMIGGLIIVLIIFLFKKEFVKKYLVWIPLFLTLCGIFADLPDFPELIDSKNHDNIWDEYAESLPTEHAGYNLFFFHNWMDNTFKERFMFPGIQVVIGMYSLIFVGYVVYFRKEKVLTWP